MPEESSPYAVLGLSPSATADQVRAAYRAKAKQVHPDRPGGSAAGFVAVRQAYEVLRDPARRAELDRARARPDLAPPPPPPARPTPGPDLSGVAATTEDLDARWEEVVGSFGTPSHEPHPRPRRRGWAWWRG